MSSDRRKPSLTPASTALVCVECQNGVLGPDSMLPALAAGAQPALKVIARLLTAARAADVLVVHAPYAGRLQGDPGTTPLMRSTAPATADWSPGHPATEILTSLHEPTDLLVPRHQGVSPTWGTELLPILRARRVQTVIYVGVSLNVAIPLAVGQTANEGFDVVVVRDAAVGSPPEYGELVLRNTISMLAHVAVADEVIRAWQITVCAGDQS